jgi:hypothetical protein
MSKRETPFTRRFWLETGGTLVEEFRAVRRGRDRGQRLIDGVIIPEGEFGIRHTDDVDIAGQDVICVQTKDSRLGMYLLGQAYFSISLLQEFQPHSIRSVAICTRHDDVLEPIAREEGIEVVVYDDISAEELALRQTAVFGLRLGSALPWPINVRDEPLDQGCRADQQVVSDKGTNLGKGTT